MKQPFYDFTFANQNILRYFFDSKGTQIITKVVDFQPINTSIYNLAFGDFNKETQDFDDDVRSNNNDIRKVFATIFQICNDFFIQNPNKVIYLEGNTLTKRKLYQRIIKNNLSDLENNFVIFGVIDEDFEVLDFTKNYDAFVIKLKKI
ncbi:MAG: hypothetical protein EAZ20_01600 [Bacteroidetes bacterium]|nr:MAG: hypothetical protein EAZ20_01600 [Bacteroidota bacterium]